MHYTEEPKRELLSGNEAPVIVAEIPPKHSHTSPLANSPSDSARGRTDSESDDDTSDPTSHVLTSRCEVHAPPDADDGYREAARRRGDVESACWSNVPGAPVVAILLRSSLSQKYTCLLKNMEELIYRVILLFPDARCSYMYMNVVGPI